MENITGKRKYVCNSIRCKVCGFEFTPKSRKAMYCSNACKQYAYRESLRLHMENRQPQVFIYSRNSNKEVKHREKEISPEKWMNDYMRTTGKTR
ncbi:hypothetical protein KY321_05010, partial [Candidatus Woesearchaeota archaeon]|nr:hypothetical protein [Candidatus Woesearchaeota archaeon]